MKIKGVIATVLLAASFMTSVQAEENSATVQTIEINVSSLENIPEPIRQRMEKSVYSVAQQLFEEKKVDNIRENSESYERIIAEVFDKILVGYDIEKVKVNTGESVAVNIQLAPWHDTINSVETEVAVEGMSPLVEKMVLQDAAGIDKVFSGILQDLPVGAVDWSNGVLKQNVNKFLAERLPEFRADFDVAVAQQTKVKVVLYPKLPVVRTLDLQMRSDTFPNFFLLSLRKKTEVEARELIGVPVAFLDRHRQDFEAHYAEMLDLTDGFQYFHVKTNTLIKLAENMTLMSRSNLQKLRVRGESWTDIGHRHYGNDMSSRAKGYLGWQPTNRDSIYFYGEYYPKANEWGWHTGYQRNIYGKLWAGLQYDLRHSKWETEVSYNFNKRWSLEHEYRKYDNQSEWGLKYKLHDYLALKLMRDKDGTWLRLIGTI